MSSPNPIYDYFTKVKWIKGNAIIIKYKCNNENCSQLILWKGSPTNLKNHLKLHFTSYADYQAQMKRKIAGNVGDDIPPPKRQATLSQPNIVTALANASNLELNDSIALAFIMNGWSIRAAECKYFRKALGLYKENKMVVKLPNRQLLREAILRQHDRLKTELVERLKQNNCAVSLLLDGWTNVNKTKVTNLLLVSRGVAYYWCSLNNAHSVNNADWLYSAIKPQLDSILEHGIPVVSYVADNEYLMSSTHNKLLQDFPFLLSTPCAAHTVQLVVKGVLKDPFFVSVIAEAVSLINLFISNKAQRLLLKNAQPESAQYSLIRPCETRWSYTLIAIQRLLKLRRYIDQSLEEGKQPQKDVSFWGKLGDLVKILTPFRTATDVLQQDHATLFDVAKQFQTLQQHANTLKEKNPSISQLILSCIAKEWANHVNENATIAAGILSGVRDFSGLYEPRKVIAAQEFILDWGSKYLQFYQLSNEKDIKKELTNQFLEFLNLSQRFASFSYRINATRKTINKHGEDLEFISPISVWHSFQAGANELSSVAVALLSVTASEAPVERSFSIQDRLHSKSRNRSKDDLIEAEVFSKFNKQALDNAAQPVTFDLIEISETAESCEQVELSYFLPEKITGNTVNNTVEEELDEEIIEESDIDIEEEAEEKSVILNPAPIPLASEEQIKQFIINYIQQHQLTKSTRLFRDRENTLANAILQSNPRVILTVMDAKKLIKSLAPSPL